MPETGDPAPPRAAATARDARGGPAGAAGSGGGSGVASAEGDVSGEQAIAGEGATTAGPAHRGVPSAEPPWRFGDLDRRGRVVALVLAALLVLPFGWSATRALRDGYRPSGDEALIALRTHDVLSRRPPLVGQPSTSDLYSPVRTNHPGPIAFWLFALPQRVAGPAVAQAFGAALVNALAVLTAAWAALRRAGPGVALGAAALIAAATWAQGTAVLSDPISSNLGGFAFLAVASCAWALLRGDVRLAPLAAFWASFTAQQHLGIVLPTAVVTVVGLAGLSAVLVRRWRAVHPDAGRRVPPDRHARVAAGDRRRHDLRWLAWTGVLVALLWAPVAIQQATGDPGNLTQIIRFSRRSDRPILGWGRGLDQALRAVGSPSLFWRADVTGGQLNVEVPAAGAVAGVAVLALLAVVAVVARRRRPELASLAAIGLAVTAAGLWNGANLLEGIEADRVNLFRWMWTAAIVAWLTLAWAGLSLAGRLARRDLPVVVRRSAPALVALALLAGTVGAFSSRSRDDERRDKDLFGIEGDIATEVRARLPGRGRYLVVADGPLATLSVAPALALDLEQRGWSVEVPAAVAPSYGERRRYRRGTVRGVVVVRSALGTLGPAPGTIVGRAQLNPRFDALATLLEPLVRGQRIVLRRDVEARLRRIGMPPFERYGTELRISDLGRRPALELRQTVVARGLAAGALESPRLPPDLVRQLAESLREGSPLAWDQNVIEARLLTPAEYEAWRS
ncbi:MAG: hypothetical protein HYX34_01060 [Actinobacteria bacterium]|nr:hypothetical protein [Actinomycetota bacterium]